MTRYRMEDGTVIDTANATATWEEQRDFDGNNMIGRTSGSQWGFHTLYRSRRGRYYLVTISQWQGSRPRAEWVSPQAAAAFLLQNEHGLPADLQEVAAEISE